MGKLICSLDHHRMVTEGLLPDGYAADDGVGLHFINGTLATMVSSRPHAQAYRVERQDEGVQETVLKPTYLGD